LRILHLYRYFRIFERVYCKEETDERYDNEELLDGSFMGIEEASMVMKTCRFCELACPAA